MPPRAVGCNRWLGGSKRSLLQFDLYETTLIQNGIGFATVCDRWLPAHISRFVRYSLDETASLGQSFTALVDANQHAIRM